MQRVTLIDNYDSFTFNLVHYLGELGADVCGLAQRRDHGRDVLAEKPDAIVLSPGPCTPNEAGICLDLVRAASERRRCSASASAIRRSARPLAARSCARRCRCTASLPHPHNARGLFRGLNGPFQATRYHSLVIERASAPAEARSHRRDRRRAHHGGRASRAPGAWRAVPSREHRLRARPSILRNFLDLAALSSAPQPHEAHEDMESFKPLLAKVAAGADAEPRRSGRPLSTRCCRAR